MNRLITKEDRFLLRAIVVWLAVLFAEHYNAGDMKI